MLRKKSPYAMTNQELNREIAELRGYRVERAKNGNSYRAHHPCGKITKGSTEELAWAYAIPRYDVSADACIDICEAEGWRYSVETEDIVVNGEMKEGGCGVAFVQGAGRVTSKTTRRALAIALLFALRRKARRLAYEARPAGSILRGGESHE